MTGLGPRLGELGELELLRLLQPHLQDAGGALIVGAGDDAAVWQPAGGLAVAVTTDSLVEDVHFHAWPGDSAFYTDLGWKLLAVSLSDLAATGAGPGPAFLALALPSDWPVSDLEAVYQGLAECALASGAGLAGGNLSDAATAVLTSTCLGEVDPRRALRRDGAKPGWQLAVTGSLGGAAAALRLLHNPEAEAAKLVADADRATWTRRLRRPQPRLAAGKAIVEEGIGVCLDVSDGLYADAGRLLRAGLGVVIEAERLPIEPGLQKAFPGAWIEVIGGGEDYELLFAGPQDKVRAACRRITAGGLAASMIGVFDETEGVRVRPGDGPEAPAPSSGHSHFGT